MRHAKSDWNNEGLSDHERTLNKRGKRDLPLMASVMIQKYPKVDCALSSDSKRTIETIEGIKNFGYPISKIEYSNDLYLASINKMESALAGLSNDVETALICAHNPGIAEYIEHLTKEPFEVPTLGMALIVLNIDDWTNIFSAEGRMVRCDYPNKK